MKSKLLPPFKRQRQHFLLHLHIYLLLGWPWKCQSSQRRCQQSSFIQSHLPITPSSLLCGDVAPQAFSSLLQLLPSLKDIKTTTSTYHTEQSAPNRRIIPKSQGEKVFQQVWQSVRASQTHNYQFLLRSKFIISLKGNHLLYQLGNLSQGMIYWQLVELLVFPSLITITVHRAQTSLDAAVPSIKIPGEEYVVTAFS